MQPHVPVGAGEDRVSGQRIPGTDQSIVLCHYAMAVWDKSHRGNLMLYGHSHSEAEPWLEEKASGDW